MRRPIGPLQGSRANQPSDAAQDPPTAGQRRPVPSGPGGPDTCAGLPDLGPVSRGPGPGGGRWPGSSKYAEVGPLGRPSGDPLRSTPGPRPRRPSRGRGPIRRQAGHPAPRATTSRASGPRATPDRGPGLDRQQACDPGQPPTGGSSGPDRRQVGGAATTAPTRAAGALGGRWSGDALGCAGNRPERHAARAGPRPSSPAPVSMSPASQTPWPAAGAGREPAEERGAHPQQAGSEPTAEARRAKRTRPRRGTRLGRTPARLPAQLRIDRGPEAGRRSPQQGSAPTSPVSGWDTAAPEPPAVGPIPGHPGDPPSLAAARSPPWDEPEKHGTKGSAVRRMPGRGWRPCGHPDACLRPVGRKSALPRPRDLRGSPARSEATSSASHVRYRWTWRPGPRLDEPRNAASPTGTGLLAGKGRPNQDLGGGLRWASAVRTSSIGSGLSSRRL